MSHQEPLLAKECPHEEEVYNPKKDIKDLLKKSAFPAFGSLLHPLF